ncbi:MAG: hypothetical protein JNK79_04585 [Chitinophagaceae bacterium]|nr:hypothetical protein [Chitinophagaceae bacterium]
MLLIVCAWIAWFLVSLSIGSASLKLISLVAGGRTTSSYNLFYRFWFGFAVLVALLQIISLFLPIGNSALGIICVVALAGIILNAKNVFTGVSLFFKSSLRLTNILAFLGVLIVLILVSYSANKNVTHTDTFIYHYNAVKWVKEYSVVPGLANLHGRLGFNSSFFLFAALTETGIYTGHSAQVALSFLMVMALLHWLSIISNRRSYMPSRIFCMMTIVFIAIHIGLKMDIASLATDYPMAIVILVFCLALIDKIENKALLLLSLSALAFTFKLSGMPAIAIALIAVAGRLWYLRYREGATNVWKQQWRLSVASFAVLCIVAGGFITRNIIVSGWLIYPFPVGNLHLPWSSPGPYVLDLIAWIKSYPKIPGGASPQTIEGNTFYYWFTQWFYQFMQTFEYVMLFASSVFLVWAGLQTPRLSQFIYSRRALILLLLFALLSIVFWFTSAPDVRFGSVYFYILLGASVAILYESSSEKKFLKLAIYAGFTFMVVHHTPAYAADRHPMWFTLAQTVQPKLVRVIASPPGENPPLYIYMPAEGNQCGDSPLPCTPYAGGKLHVHQLIRQRVPGDISKGFLPPK